MTDPEEKTQPDPKEKNKEVSRESEIKQSGNTQIDEHMRIDEEGNELSSDDIH